MKKYFTRWFFHSSSDDDSVNKAESEQVDALRQCKLFDANWYLAQYPDVAEALLDPYLHYIRHGGAELREPGPDFDTTFYLQQFESESSCHCNPEELAPLIHYLWHGHDAGFLPKQQLKEKPWWAKTGLTDSRGGGDAQADDFDLIRGLAQLPDPAVVVPIYNAFEELAACLESIQKYTRLPCRVILINDASPDPRVSSLLEQYHDDPGFECYENDSNLGFTATVNKGIKIADRSDVVFLNADTQVAPGWLGRLRYAAYQNGHIGTVTPFSDNAGAFSAPEPGGNNLPAGFDYPRFGRAIAQTASHYYPRVPTGNGFCLYVRRDCLDEVGFLDEQAFPRGYGEENDFCMRARNRGWTHIIDDATFVHHVRSASFGEEKHALMAAGRSIIDHRFPRYTELVREAFSGEELAQARLHVAHLYQLDQEKISAIKPRVLYVISSRSGGTPQTNQDLMTALSDRIESFVLHSNRHTLTLELFKDGVYKEVARHNLTEPVRAFPHTSAEYDATVLSWLHRWGIELIHVRHIAWHSLGLINAAKVLGIPRVFSFHDFYSICPTVKLLDDRQQFCAGKCSVGAGFCQPDLWPKKDFISLKHGQVKTWQKRYAYFLQKCDAFVTTNTQARSLLLEHYPELACKPFEVIPHGRDFDELNQLAAQPQGNEPLRLLVPGNITVAKGGSLIAELAETTDTRDLEIHILGKISPAFQLPDSVICHGEYERDFFHEQVRAIKPHVGAVLSIWPETWCHTLTEMWAAGIPVVGLDFGAVGERLRDSGAGWVLSEPNTTSLRSLLLQLQHNSDWLEKYHAVLSWQNNVAPKQSRAAMAAEYWSLYQQTSKALV